MLGFPIKISPSLANIGASTVPLLLGDFSYWISRLMDDSAGVQVYCEAPGLIENGNVGLRCYCRADGNLAWTDTSSPAPIQYLRMHS
jgi:HK97 family phage major capsid protein